jgi:hypothetical protein
MPVRAEVVLRAGLLEQWPHHATSAQALTLGLTTQ